MRRADAGSSVSPSSRRGPLATRRLLTTTMVMAVLLTIVATAPIAAGMAPAAEEEPRVEFLDAAGNRQDRPYFDVEGAFPGMPSRTETVVVHNAGRGAVVHDLDVLITSGTQPRFVGDVLVLTVLTTDSRRVLYRGPLVDAEVVDASLLRVGEDASYEVVIEWPERGRDDNRYQGKTLAFTFRVTARPARARH